nr:immunoglobulin heavy chain junction region [Macaca mulatta]
CARDVINDTPLDVW